MTDFILKTFVGTNLNYSDKQIRNKIGIFTNSIGIAFNILLFIIKFVIGLASNSISIMSDSINNLNDSISSIVSLLGFKFSAKNADAEHPFGHGRIEYVSAFIISFIIMWFGLEFFRISFNKILNPEPMTMTTNMFLFLFFTVLVKLWLGFFNKYIGKKINSNAILATAKDNFSDVFVTTTTIVSSYITMYTGYIIDGYAGIIVSIIIFYSGYQIAKNALSTLIGEAVSPDVAEQIYSLIANYKDVVGAHDLIIHSYGTNNYLATIHVEVPSSFTFQQSHQLVDDIEKEIFSSLNIHLTTHVDPVDLDNEQLLIIRPVIKEYVHSLNENFTMNDLRIISTKFDSKIIFEICVPIGFTEKNIISIQQSTKKFIETLYPSFECIVSIQKNYSPKSLKGDKTKDE